MGDTPLSCSPGERRVLSKVKFETPGSWQRPGWRTGPIPKDRLLTFRHVCVLFLPMDRALDWNSWVAGYIEPGFGHIYGDIHLIGRQLDGDSPIHSIKIKDGHKQREWRRHVRRNISKRVRNPSRADAHEMHFVYVKKMRVWYDVASVLRVRIKILLYHYYFISELITSKRRIEAYAHGKYRKTKYVLYYSRASRTF